MKITLKNLIKLIVLSAWIFLSVSFHSAAQGQTVYKRGATQLESLLPPAPEAASAVRFVDVPFSHSQGLACLDIPVYTVKGRELSIPVSLSYASGGVKLDEVAGVAGLGWRLEAGGCVTRTVVDMPDEFLSAELSHGMPSQAMLAKLGDPDDRSSEKAAFLRDIVWHRTDVSLDRYSYNVCGLSGSFVILDDGSVFHLSGDGVGISYAGTPFTGVTAFTLTGPDGTVYVLDVTETGRHDGSRDSPVSRGNVLTDYRATQVMQRILQGDLRLEDIYHYPVMTSSNPGRLPVTERHVEYHSDGNEETTVTTAYTPRAGISVPARPVTVSLMSGGVTRSVSYTYPDTWDGPEQWVEGLRSAHALSIPLKRDYRIWTDSPSAIPHKSERTGYSHYTVGGAARLLPSSSVELTDGMESWREDILSRDSLGNVSSVKERGHPVASVLWSWNGLHPAAVIENAGIGEVVAVIGSQGAVDALTSSIRPSTSQLSAVDGLRDAPSLAGSHVRTFTFSPGMGLTSATDPAGIRTTYEYDTHGRLAFVRDDDGAAMEGYSYSLLSDGDGHRSARRRSYRDAGGETYSEDVVWWNTLGLKLEDIAVAASGDGRDLVTSFGSDFMMHDDVKVWLPYPTDTEAGTFQDNAAGAAASHHSSHLAFTHKKYERSSRDRVLTVAEPGLSGTHVTTYGHGVWMDERKHLSGANAYNKEWEAFFEKYSNATKEDIMKKAEELMQKVYGK